LFGSPLYAAFQLYAPAALNVEDTEFGIIPFDTTTSEPTIVPDPLQVELE